MVNTRVKGKKGSVWQENKLGIVFNSNDVKERPGGKDAGDVRRKEMKIKEKKAQDTYITLSKIFQSIRGLFKNYSSTLYGDIEMVAQSEENKRNISLLDRFCSNENFLVKRIVKNEQLLLKRIAIFSKIGIKSNSYSKQPEANITTKHNILEIKHLLESHELNIRSNVYEKYEQELQCVQRALNLYKRIAQELNSYLIEQNQEEAQIADDPIRYPNNGRVILIFTKDGKLNTEALGLQKNTGGTDFFKSLGF
jgi:hypothetical protein